MKPIRTAETVAITMFEALFEMTSPLLIERIILMTNQKRNKEQPQRMINHIISKIGWKKLDGFARNYYASQDGNIYSIVKTSGKLRELKTHTPKSGYKMVKLKEMGGKYKDKSVHRLILNAFIPNPKNKPLGHHKDHDRLNNAVNNLEWVTYKENSRRRKDNDKN